MNLYYPPIEELELKNHQIKNYYEDIFDINSNDKLRKNKQNLI